MACNLDQVGQFDDFCSCLTEIQENKTRYLDFKNDLSKLWRQIQLWALCFQIASLDGLDRSKSSSQPKHKENKYKSWNFQYRLQTYILGVLWVSTDEKKILLVEHLQTQLGYHSIFNLKLSFPLLSSAISNWYFVFRQMEVLWFWFLWSDSSNPRLLEQDSTYYGR